MGCIARLSAIVVLLSVSAARAVTFGQSDTFTVNNQSWTNGAPAVDPVNVTTGGPAGVGDHFMQVTATGGGGPGSKLVVLNNSQWLGNYITSGVTGIRVDFKNLGASTLTMRFAMQDAAGTQYATSGFTLASGSGWVTTTFSLLPANLNLLTGSDSATQVLGNVTQFRLLSSSSPSFLGDTIVGQVGVDNIAAIPEPASLLVLALGGIACLAKGGRR